jgi:acetylornithine deacetylase
MDEAFLLDTLELLCGTRSPPGKEAALALALADHARARGFETAVTRVTRDRPNVVIQTGGEGQRSLMFNAHLDMQVPPSPMPTTPRLQLPWFYGEGVNNMKAGLAAMLAALDGYRQSGGSGRLVVLAACGEIDALGLGTTAALRSGLTADAAINGEPTGLQVVLRHAGIARFRIVAVGRGAHLSQRPRGANAVVAIAQVVSGLNESVLSSESSDLFPGLPMLNVGIIHGGIHASMLAESAYAEVDVRWAPPMTQTSIRRDLEAYVSHLSLEHGVGIKIQRIGRPRLFAGAPFVSRPEWPVVRCVEQAHREVVGAPAMVGSWLPMTAYGSDAPHLVSAGIPTCMYGPGTSEASNLEDERIAWDDVLTAARVYELAAQTFLTSW